MKNIKIRLARLISTWADQLFKISFAWLLALFVASVTHEELLRMEERKGLL